MKQSKPNYKQVAISNFTTLLRNVLQFLLIAYTIKVNAYTKASTVAFGTKITNTFSALQNTVSYLRHFTQECIFQ